MRYLPSTWIPCAECDGLRFTDEVLAARLQAGTRQYSIADFYELSIEEVQAFFLAETRLPAAKLQTARQILDALCEIGLGYLTLGQASTHAFGRRGPAGEAGALPGEEIARQGHAGAGRAIDRPAPAGSGRAAGRARPPGAGRGDDRGGRAQHRRDPRADWVIDLGPGAGPRADELLYAGPPEGLVECSRILDRPGSAARKAS